MPTSPQVILVLGPHRSGTSATTRALGLLGGALPHELVPEAPDNPKGFWEPLAVQLLHEKLLLSLGTRWDDPLPLPPEWTNGSAAVAARAEIGAFLAQELGREPLLLKDPRLCRTIDLWLAVLSERGIRAAAALTVRHPFETAMSLSTRNGLSLTHGVWLWLTDVLVAEAATRNMTRTYIAYDQLVDDWRTALTPAANALGIEADVSGDVATELDAFLTDELRHHRSDTHATVRAAIPQTLVDLSETTYDVLAGSIGESSVVEKDMDAVRESYKDLARLVTPLLEALRRQREEHAHRQLQSERQVIETQLVRERRCAEEREATLKQALLTVESRLATIENTRALRLARLLKPRERLSRLRMIWQHEPPH